MEKYDNKNCVYGPHEKRNSNLRHARIIDLVCLRPQLQGVPISKSKNTQ